MQCEMENGGFAAKHGNLERARGACGDVAWNRPLAMGSLLRLVQNCIVSSCSACLELDLYSVGAQMMRRARVERH